MTRDLCCSALIIDEETILPNLLYRILLRQQPSLFTVARREYTLAEMLQRVLVGKWLCVAKEAHNLNDLLLANPDTRVCACLLQGSLKFYGICSDQNWAEAARIFRVAADAGNDIGFFNLGVCYDRGYGETEDANEASRLFKKAFLKGNLTAACNWGLCLLHGRGVPIDENAGFESLKFSSLGGNAVAQYSFGLCYLLGTGTTKDLTLGVKWLTESALQGQGTAFYSLGNYYWDLKDKREGRRNYLAGATFGDEPSKSKLSSR